MVKTSSDQKRYHLVLPEALYSELQKAAADKNTTVVSLLRRFIRLGLLALKAQDEPDSALVFKNGKRERRILFTPEDLILHEKDEHREKEKEFEFL